MWIDCDRCEVRGINCDDCVVNVLLGAPPSAAGLDEEDQVALGVLASSGLVPPLRLSVSSSEGSDDTAYHSA